ncbi:hypothetical protein FA95DRAFT_1565719 [Auriscalpium vulgare]|uniref:Uncharacterized protein n=1 Tax=Auriscalpium vulgare TaxID=40419 RepID=A0ACB8RB87_9AGAM|nr:hypothetical protein FA95DRAFT_1565719 [Auriscalpium vulgare]
MSTPTTQEIEAVAKRTADILNKRGLTCCLMGSAASALWGATRTPNDIDMVVMCSDMYSQEDVKRMIVADDATYYLVASTNWRNSYKILWTRIPDRRGVTCKVDILVPPTLTIPTIAPLHIVWVRDVPIMPLFTLILMKLKGWEDHRVATFRRPDLRAKQHVDVEDIKELLDIAAKRGEKGEDESWLTYGFLSAGKVRVRMFSRMFMLSEQFAAIGL